MSSLDLIDPDLGWPWKSYRRECLIDLNKHHYLVCGCCLFHCRLSDDQITKPSHWFLSVWLRILYIHSRPLHSLLLALTQSWVGCGFAPDLIGRGVFMWRSWSKFAFIECEFQLTNSFKCELECKCQFNSLKATFVVRNKLKTHCISQTTFVGNWELALVASLNDLLLLLSVLSVS